MPRKPTVTRSCTVITVTCLVAKLQEQVLEKKKYFLFRTCKNDKLYLKACKAIETDENIDILKVVEVKSQRALAKMDERKYFDNAEIIYLD